MGTLSAAASLTSCRCVRRVFGVLARACVYLAGGLCACLHVGADGCGAGAGGRLGQLLSQSRPVQSQENFFSFQVVTFGSPLIFQSADESPDQYPKAAVLAKLALLHTHARNYVSCHDLVRPHRGRRRGLPGEVALTGRTRGWCWQVPRILCCRGEQLERLKKILVEGGKEKARNSAWAIWMVVEGRAEQAINGMIEGIMNILRSVNRQGQYILVGDLMQVCTPKACFLKDPGADFYRFRMDSPWTHIAPNELIESAFTPPEWLHTIPENTSIKRAVKGHSMSGLYHTPYLIYGIGHYLPKNATTSVVTL